MIRTPEVIATARAGLPLPSSRVVPRVDPPRNPDLLARTLRRRPHFGVAKFFPGNTGCSFVSRATVARGDCVRGTSATAELLRRVQHFVPPGRCDGVQSRTLAYGPRLYVWGFKSRAIGNGGRPEIPAHLPSTLISTNYMNRWNFSFGHPELVIGTLINYDLSVEDESHGAPSRDLLGANGMLNAKFAIYSVLCEIANTEPWLRPGGEPGVVGMGSHPRPAPRRRKNCLGTDRGAATRSRRSVGGTKEGEINWRRDVLFDFSTLS
ncbi:hypothetical protein NL676_016561 [Syzygium grande]|nr:hypothetical protein NL676_016561 [Syzygium grande]